MSENVLNLPHFGIQCDWEDVFSTGKCWITLRNFEQETSIHGDLKQDEVTPDRFSLVKEKSGQRYVTLKDKEEGECSFVACSSAIGIHNRRGVIGLDVTEGGLGVSVCQNNDLKIWETTTGNIRMTLTGHPIDTYNCQFFPSGIVVLTSGADCCLKVWSAETGECPVTMKGHFGAVNDTCIVERGRNVISLSKDGTSKLWDVGESKCLATLFSCNSPLNSGCLMSPSNQELLGPSISNMSDREILTTGKLLLIGREDGKVTAISVAAREELFTCSLPSAVNKVISVGSSAFAVGCQGGEIAVFQLNNLSHPLRIISSTKSPILDMMVHRKNQSSETIMPFWVSKADGTCMLINPSSQPCKKFIQLTGSNCDPVYRIKSDLDFIYTACRDGIIRKYSFNVINRLLSS